MADLGGPDSNDQYMLYGSDKLKHNYPNNINGILDSGSSGHFLTTFSSQIKIQQQHKALTIKQPDGDKLMSQHKIELAFFKELEIKAREAYLYSNLTFSLISVAKLCENGCMATFLPTRAIITYKNKIIASAQRDKSSNLWTIPLNNLNDCKHNHDKDVAMNITIPQEAQGNIERFVMFLYEAIGFPAKSTLIEAIMKGHFAT